MRFYLNIFRNSKQKHEQTFHKTTKGNERYEDKQKEKKTNRKLINNKQRDRQFFF